MNQKLISSIVILSLMLVLLAGPTEAHKKYFSAPVYGPDRCNCDCGPHGGHGGPILPNKPYYGSAGYAPRPSGGGYGNAGSYAVAGSYGAGGGQVSGGY